MENILVSEKGHYVLCDFGSATAKVPKGLSLTRAYISVRVSVIIKEGVHQFSLILAILVPFVSPFFRHLMELGGSHRPKT